MISTNLSGPIEANDAIYLSEIDRQMRVPSIMFICFGLFWLLVGTIFALVASIKLHNPGFLGNYEFLTFGRARSAHLNAMAFGWLNNAIFALAPWVMARLCRTTVRHGGLLLIGGVLYNAAIFVGIIGILTPLAGGITSVEWLEIPPTFAPFIALSYILIAMWGVLCFRYRYKGHVYVSQWYILGALFWFPWLYVVAQLVIFFDPARGTAQALANWWLGHNVLGLWFTPMSVALIYYLLPKIIGKPIYSYYLSVLGFWALAFFYNWAGVHHLIGGPIPSWIISAGVVASIMMFIPVIATGINHHMTAAANWRQVWISPTLRFIIFGAINYTGASFLGSAMALRHVNEVTHFTQFTVGHAHHGVYAFVTMVMFGAIYFVMPRFLNREWPSARLISLHFWFVSIGIIVMLLALHVGGWIQGLQLNDPTVPYTSADKSVVTIIGTLLPFLISRSVSGVLLTIGHIIFVIHFVWMLSGYRRKSALEETLIVSTDTQAKEA